MLFNKTQNKKIAAFKNTAPSEAEGLIEDIKGLSFEVLTEEKKKKNAQETG